MDRRGLATRVAFVKRLCSFVIGWLALSAAAFAQDLVIVSSSSDPAARTKKQGSILDYTGSELTLRSPFGTTEKIPASRVVEIQSTWTASHEAGLAARAAGRLEEAIAALREAKREEQRPWVQRRIAAELVGTYLKAGRIDSAGDEFIGILASDASTVHFDVIPIA